jgi:hypothetical protein
MAPCALAGILRIATSSLLKPTHSDAYHVEARALYCCKPGVRKVSQCVRCVKPWVNIAVSVARNAREQLTRPALLRADTMFSRRRRHHWLVGLRVRPFPPIWRACGKYDAGAAGHWVGEKVAIGTNRAKRYDPDTRSMGRGGE